jgi:hypothetical protein
MSPLNVFLVRCGCANCLAFYLVPLRCNRTEILIKKAQPVFTQNGVHIALSKANGVQAGSHFVKVTVVFEP